MQPQVICVIIVILIVICSHVSTCVNTKTNVRLMSSPEISQYRYEEKEKQILESKVFDDLPDSNLKTKAAELRDAYNDRDADLAKAEARINQMRNTNRCSEEAAEQLMSIIRALRAQNDELKAQYNVLLHRAEVIYANRLVNGQEVLDRTLLADTDAMLKKHKEVTLIGDDGKLLTTLVLASRVPASGGSAATSFSRDGVSDGQAKGEGSNRWNGDLLQGRLLEAVMYSSAGEVEALISRGAPPNAYKGDIGKTLLHLAVDAESLETVQALLKGNADPNARNNEGRTPIYSAIYRQNEAIVKALLDGGAKTKVQDKWKITPLEFAKERRCKPSIITLLKNNKK